MLLCNLLHVGIAKIAVAIEKCHMLCSRKIWHKLETTASRLVKDLRDHRSEFSPTGFFWKRALSVFLAYRALAFMETKQWKHVIESADLAFAVGGPEEFVSVAEQCTAAMDQSHMFSILDVSKSPSNINQQIKKPELEIKHPIMKIDAAHLPKHLLEQPNIPVIVYGMQQGWKASQQWSDIPRMVQRFGSRFVPLELGVWPDLVEDMMELGEFFLKYFSVSIMEQENEQRSGNDQIVKRQHVAYLAQHNLFEQIPSLYDDISVPTVCTEQGRALKEASVWWGSKGTVTPIHYDSFPNLLAQVVGYKYVRLYAPSETPYLYPGTSDGSADKILQDSLAIDANYRHNISTVGDPRNADLARFPKLQHACYEEHLLSPGETLYIPASHWHFLTSQSPSMSVNFWWHSTK